MTSAEAAPQSATPTECSRCGQRLYLLAEGRDVCERCRLGRSGDQRVNADGTASEATGKTVRQACVGCGRTETDQGGFPLAVADGYCLSCRVQRAHAAG
ncbi:MAG TPA: hypothetical protein VGH99_15860 [Pseudonocardia sp.]|jgi:hypothetical protein